MVHLFGMSDQTSAAIYRQLYYIWKNSLIGHNSGSGVGFDTVAKVGKILDYTWFSYESPL